MCICTVEQAKTCSYRDNCAELRYWVDVSELRVHIKTESVHHPTHYGGADNLYEVINVIEAWDLHFSLGNAVKYIARAGKKEGVSDVEDLQKAAWYLNRELKRREDAAKENDRRADLRRDEAVAARNGDATAARSESA